MAKVTSHLNRSSLTSMAKGIGSTFVRQQFAPALKAEIAARAPGSLKGKVQVRPSASGGAEVGFFGPEAPIARILNTGAAPHVIRAKNTSALVFFWDQVSATTVVPLKGLRFTGRRGDKFYIGKGHVDHPGFKGNDFMKEALTAAKARVLFSRGGGGRFASGR